MKQIIDQALTLWRFENATVRLVAARENAVYEVKYGSQRYALRLHRQGYRSDVELRSELLWMNAMADGSLSVPSPIASVEGEFLHTIDQIQVDVLSWLNGSTFEQALEIASATERVELFVALGRDMAMLHNLSDAWEIPSNFQRCHWDQAGLVGKTPLWDRFWDNPELNPDDKRLFEAFREKAKSELKALEGSLDYGLIHADLVPANVMVDGKQLHLIDFDDGGFGYRLFDVATALLKHQKSYDFLSLKTALIDGYSSARALDTRHLDLFIALRATTYVGWNITRMNEDKTGERNTRFINTARELIDKYLEN